jgi:hypothetical protein
MNFKDQNTKLSTDDEIGAEAKQKKVYSKPELHILAPHQSTQGGANANANETFSGILAPS